MATVRSMTQEDLLSYKRLCSICYTYIDAGEPRPCTEEELHQRVGVFDDDGTLLSAMTHNDYKARFEGRDVKLVGVGGVVTDPVARGQRSVRKLFETYLPRLREEGYVFGALYPFSHVFYRKFGYELGFERRMVELKRDSLRNDFCCADEIVRVLPDEDDRGMRRIYERYAADKDYIIIRNDAMWRELRSGTPWEKMKYAYVLKRGGESVAYWIGTAKKEDWRGIVTIQDMAYTCREGLEAIFAMLCGMNEFSSIQFRMPAELNPRWLLRDPHDVTAESVSCGGMLRVIDVEKALSLVTAPRFAGRFTVEVRDEQITENNGRFTVSGDGRMLQVARDDDAPVDLRCTVNGLSALMGGLQDFEDAVLAGHAEVLRDEERAFMAAVFRRRKSHLNWNF